MLGESLVPQARGVARALAPVAAAVATEATTWPLPRAVLGGAFADPDDAMRLVEVRAWMAGQPWFDTVARGLDPPTGASMHWSRLVDVPNAALIDLFGLLGLSGAGWDRLVLPTVLLALLYAGVARLAAVLLGRGARLPALVGLFFTGVTLVQFQPGRIGHHGPETVVLVWAVTLALEGLETGRARAAAGAGLLVALGLAMSLETLPFLVGLCAALALVWVVRGQPAAAALRAFAGALGLALAGIFVATVPPGRWLAPVCDALGTAHLGAALVFAVGGWALPAATGLLATRRRRLAAAVMLGAGAAAWVAIAFPACLHSPFAKVDPLVRAIWLDHVVESQSLLAFATGHFWLALAISAPLALGTLGSLWAARRLCGLAGERFAVVAGLAAVGLALGCWQIRVFASTAPLALCGGLYLAEQLRARLAAAGVRWAYAFGAAAVLPFTSTAWALALPPDAAAPAGLACLAPAAMAPLADLPAGRVVAPIDAGSHLLEATRLLPYAAPYHRNNDGNRFALDVFLATPDEARQRLQQRGAGYVLTCAGLGETARLAARAPAGLAAALLAGRPPAFLQALPLAGTPWQVYAVQPAR